MINRTEKGYALDKFYSKIHRQYDLINKLFTFGLDKKWRRITVDICLEGNPENILDLCCGTGDIAIALAKKTNEKSRVVGYDMNRAMLRVAAHKSKMIDKERLSFQQGDACNMPFENESFNRICISFGFRNLTFENQKKDEHLREMYRVLGENGKLLILESSVPKNKLVSLFYRIHLCGFLIPVGGLLSGDVKAYRYLAHSSIHFYSPSEVESMLKGVGFKSVSVRPFLLGAANLIIAEK